MEDINCILARIYNITGEQDKFFKIALKSVADNPSSEMCYTLGLYYFAHKDYNEAAIWLYNAAFETKSILDISSSGKKPLYLLSECYKLLSEQCEDDYEKIQYVEMSNDYKSQADSWCMPEL